MTENTKQQINISPSSINTYNESPLIYYFQYVVKKEPDTPTMECYGQAGSLVHDVLEHYISEQEGITQTGEDTYIMFDEGWYERKLDSLKGFRNQILSRDEYLRAVMNGQKRYHRYKEQYTNTTFIPEEVIEMPFYEGKNFSFCLKGIIDVVIRSKENDWCVIVDHKTSSKVSNDPNFLLQGKHYAYLVYKKYGIVPEKVVFDYVKLPDAKNICKRKTFVFTEEELIEHEQYLVSFAQGVDEKGYTIGMYKIGKIDSPFNQFRKSCEEEMNRRSNALPLEIRIANNRMFLPQHTPKKLLEVIRKKYSYRVPGYHFSEAFKKRQWDGMKCFLQEKDMSLPFAFFNDLRDLVADYNKYFQENVELRFIDERAPSIINKTYAPLFQKSAKQLRPYQEEAVSIALQKKHGILYLATAAGKSFIASEIIRRLSRRTLFIVNRNELAQQTKEDFEDDLGVEVGLMTEGNLVVSKQVTVASIQTICAIAKRNDDEAQLLRKYLANITVTIFDECQGVTDAGMYMTLVHLLRNNVYMFGLSGSPWRRERDTTLEMNALCGFIIYSKKAKELEKEGYLCPAKAFFIDNTPYRVPIEEDYHAIYDEVVVESEERNKKIVDIVTAMVERKKKVLVITKKVDHANRLGRCIENSFVITGSTDKKKRQEHFSLFRDPDNTTVLVGSSKIFSAGINIPSLDVIINASAHKSSIDSVQILGRIKRMHNGKKYGYYIDFFDDVAYLNRAAQERSEVICREHTQVHEFLDVTETIRRIDEYDGK